jgi:hypothetical protein
VSRAAIFDTSLVSRGKRFLIASKSHKSTADPRPSATSAAKVV